MASSRLILKATLFSVPVWEDLVIRLILSPNIIDFINNFKIGVFRFTENLRWISFLARWRSLKALKELSSCHILLNIPIRLLVDRYFFVAYTASNRIENEFFLYLKTQIPFQTYFKVEPLKEYTKVILMDDFMKHIAPKVWPPGKRTGITQKTSNYWHKNRLAKKSVLFSLLFFGSV